MRVDAAATTTPAEYYDDRHARGWMEAWPESKKARMLDIIRDIELGPGAKVLEFGCGEGVFAGAVKSALPGLEVHGCDISATGVAKARRRFPEVEFHHLAEDTSGPSWGAYDLIFTHHVLEHVQDLDATLTYIASLLKPKGKLLHVFPCGNEGSLEFRVASMIKGGIGEGGLFSIDDCSHVRRLSSAELEQASRRTGLTLRQAFFANQFWGGLEYLTGIYYSILLEWTLTFRGASGWSSARLRCFLATLFAASVMRQAPANVLKTYRRPRSAWKRAVFLAALPFAALAFPLSQAISAMLKRARDREWRDQKTRPHGSEAYLIFERSPLDANTMGAGTHHRNQATVATSAEPLAPLNVLSLSCVYPNPSERGLGLFVQARLRHVAEMAQVKIVAPIASIDYAGASARRVGRDGVPFRRVDGATEVLHPMWIYPPGGACLNAVLLYLRLLPCAIRVRKRFRFDLIDAHFGYPDGVAACLLARTLGVPFTITLRGNETIHSAHWLRRRVMNWALRRAQRVITVSQRLGEFALSAGVAQEKVRIIPNGIDASVFYPRNRTASREKHGIEGRARVILSVGALIERKGHMKVLRAVKALAREGTHCQLLIAGGKGREGNVESSLRRAIREFGMESLVRLEGQVSPERLAELMSAADVLALASTREGWPNVVHEAMACGLPVVATDVGAIPQMIPSRDYGSIVPVNDEQALQNGLREGLQKHWDRRLISAWAHSHSWQGVAQEVVTEMRQVVVAKRKE